MLENFFKGVLVSIILQWVRTGLFQTEEDPQMNLSIEAEKVFIRGDHPLSATAASQIGELNCAVLIRLAIGEYRLAGKNSPSIFCVPPTLSNSIHPSLTDQHQ